MVEAVPMIEVVVRMCREYRALVKLKEITVDSRRRHAVD